MQDAIRHNLNAYYLSLVGIACVIGGAKGNIPGLSTIGAAAWSAALFAFKSSPPPSSDLPAQVPDPK